MKTVTTHTNYNPQVQDSTTIDSKGLRVTSQSPMFLRISVQVRDESPSRQSSQFERCLVLFLLVLCIFFCPSFLQRHPDRSFTLRFVSETVLPNMQSTRINKYLVRGLQRPRFLFTGEATTSATWESTCPLPLPTTANVLHCNKEGGVGDVSGTSTPRPSDSDPERRRLNRENPKQNYRIEVYPNDLQNMSHFLSTVLLRFFFLRSNNLSYVFVISDV